MITPIPAILHRHNDSGKCEVKCTTRKRTKIHGDLMEMGIVCELIVPFGDGTNSVTIQLTKGQAQQLADDINFLLG